MAKTGTRPAVAKSAIIAEYLSLALAPSFEYARGIVETTFIPVAQRWGTWASCLTPLYLVVVETRRGCLLVVDAGAPSGDGNAGPIELDYAKPMAARLLREAFFAADQYLHEGERDALERSLDKALRDIWTPPGPPDDWDVARAEFFHQGFLLHQGIDHGAKDP